MTAKTIQLDKLFAADEDWRAGDCPWTFFAYPTNLADVNGLPPDELACSLLAELQARGLRVAIWTNAPTPNTTYFACKKEDARQLDRLLAELENSERFGAGFCVRRSEALFARQARRIAQDLE